MDQCYYPDVFACAILNSMPMGFYQPAQLIIDVRKHGVEVRPIDINDSDWDNKLEEQSGKYCVLRLGFLQVHGLREDDMKVLIKGRRNRYTSIHELRETGLSETSLEKLADADAFRSIGHDRRNALWEVSTKDHQWKALFTSQSVYDALEEKSVLKPCLIKLTTEIILMVI